MAALEPLVLRVAAMIMLEVTHWTPLKERYKSAADPPHFPPEFFSRLFVLSLHGEVSPPAPGKGLGRTEKRLLGNN